jgi:hypothetical protein
MFPRFRPNNLNWSESNPENQDLRSIQSDTSFDRRTVDSESSAFGQTKPYSKDKKR